MRFDLDDKYMKIIKYVTLGFIIIYICFNVLQNIFNLKFFSSMKVSFNYLAKILSPFIWGCIIAYLLLPICRYFEKLLSRVRLKKNKKTTLTKRGKHFRRAISLFLTFLLIIVVIILIFYGVYSMIGGSFKDIVKQDIKIDEIIADIKNNFDQYTSIFTNVESTLNGLGYSAKFSTYFNEISVYISKWFQDFFTSLSTNVADMGKGVINFFFGFVFASFIILSREYFAAIIENFMRLTLKEHRRIAIKETFSDINKVLSGFLRGQLIDLTLNGLVTSIVLLLLNYKFAFMVGMFAGYTNIIPYLGSYLGALPVVFVSMSSGGIQKGIIGYIIILVTQQLYITFVSPRIQGSNVGIHPLFVLLSLTIFGSLFGLIGMILAIPLAGIVQVFVKRWVRWQQNRKDVELVDLDEIE